MKPIRNLGCVGELPQQTISEQNNITCFVERLSSNEFCGLQQILIANILGN